MQTELDPEFERSAPLALPKKSHTKFLILVAVLAIVLVASIIVGVRQRQMHDRALASTSIEDAGRPPVVNVARVRASAAKSTIELPGETVPRVETPMYARVDGYLKQRPVDIGDHVKKGQLLVEIETPDLDQQLEQAQATLAQSKATLQQLTAAVLVAKSNHHLAEATAARYKKLVEDGSVAKQDYDERIAQFEVAAANVKQAEENLHAGESTVAANAANLRRLGELKQFSKLLAPYDGIVTYRSQQSDPGTLISSGNTTQSRELIKVAQIDTLRIFVNVPQSYAPMIHADQTAELIVDELPGRTFPARVRGTTNEVESASRTLLAVLLVDNPKHELLPGMYSKVRFTLPHTVTVTMLPADALVMKTEGPQAAVVGADQKIHFHKVSLGRDYGAEIEVNSGLEVGDAVVLNPTDAIRDGVTVEPKERATK